MAQGSDIKARAAQVELATFYLEDALFGMDILKVQEINKNMQRTKVPHAPEYVLGIINLRGRIVTIIDLGRKLGLDPSQLSEENRNIIVDCQDELTGLLVDRIADVVSVDSSKVLPPPTNVRGTQGRFFEGVFKTDNGLVAILNVEEVLRSEEY
jgi:purine-binding chemotaxis protein CheW